MLTPMEIARLHPHKGERFRDVRDGGATGLYLRVGRQSKSWRYRFRLLGSTGIVTLGQWPRVSIADARSMAKRLANLVRQGTDPRAARPTDASRRAEPSRGMTLRHVWQQYRSSRRADGRPRSQATLDDMEGHLWRNFAAWLDAPLAKISREAVLQRHGEIARRGPAQADQAMRYLRALLNFAQHHCRGSSDAPLLTQNPVAVLRTEHRWHALQPRRDVIPRPRLAATVAFLEAAATDPERRPGAHTQADLLLFLLYTGLRWGEASGLRWSDLDRHTWTIELPAPRGRRSTTLPLSTAAIEVIQRRPHQAEFVFAGNTGDRPLADTRSMRTAAATAATVRFSHQDLRRTFACVAETLEVSRYTLRRLLNQVVDDDAIGGQYLGPEDDRLRDATNRVGAFMRAQAPAGRGPAGRSRTG